MPESQSPNATTVTKIVGEKKNRREEKEKEGCDRWKGFESVFGESEKKINFRVLLFGRKGVVFV